MLSLPLLERNAILEAGIFLTATGLSLGKLCPWVASALGKETYMVQEHVGGKKQQQQAVMIQLQSESISKIDIYIIRLTLMRTIKVTMERG